MKWIIILLAFIGSWEQMKAQQNPIILNEKNVTDLTTAARLGQTNRHLELCTIRKQR